MSEENKNLIKNKHNLMYTNFMNCGNIIFDFIIHKQILYINTKNKKSE